MSDETKRVEKEALLLVQIREICESLAVALFLAFLFKTFEAEAFVIPTGSMAPTLKGRHKDVVCEECGYRFQTSASEEVDASTNRRSGLRVVSGVCPQCGFAQYFGDETPRPKNDARAPSFTGDRILVSKMTFDQRDLARWDVSVFRAPADPKFNYIKRIVGLPNENLRVQYGDLFVQKIEPGASRETFGQETTSEPSNSWAPDVNLADVGEVYPVNRARTLDESNEPFTIARKDYKYLRQILQVVHDDDYVAPKLQQVGWPEHWTDDCSAQDSRLSAWTRVESKKGRGFYFAGEPVSAGSENVAGLRLATEADTSPITAEDNRFYWIRYRHVVPSSNDWFSISQGELPPEIASTGIVPNNPRLIDDFSAYNAGASRRQTVGVGGRAMWDGSSADEYSRLYRGVFESDGKRRVLMSKNPDGFGCNWVGDLAISCDLSFERVDESSEALFDLVKGGVVFRCSIRPKSGEITLSVPSIREFEPAIATYDFSRRARHRFVFLNVDEEMRVVIDDQEILFPNHGGRYDDLTVSRDGGVAPLPRERDPNARDLSPVAIGARDLAVRVERVKVLRDVYYIAVGRMLEDWDSSRFTDFNSPRCDRLLRGTAPYLGDETSLSRFMSSPEQWTGYGNTKSALLTQKEGQYVAFGDNSGFSLDSRLWCDDGIPHYVDRKYLIGKAFYVYWPHGRPLPLLGSPFWPNFSDMRHID
ncbi:MAG: hypothetical protein IJM30_05320 [Thermoguttaceae bacterium]|nr:hypothetical protein [Thermoguttaceae bacterium]